MRIEMMTSEVSSDSVEKNGVLTLEMPRNRGELSRVRQALESWPKRFDIGTEHPEEFYRVWENLRINPQGEEAEEPLTEADEDNIREFEALFPVQWVKSPEPHVAPAVPRHGIRRKLAAALSIFF